MADGAAVLKLFGAIDQPDCGRLTEAIDQAGGGTPARVILDLDALSRMVSAAFAAIVMEHVRLKDAGQRLMLVCGTGRMRNLLDVSAIGQVISVFDSVEEALRASGGTDA